MLMIILDQTIVNVALPAIQDDLGFSQSSLAWVVNAYLIPFGGLLLLAGRLGDLIGRKQMFVIGLSVFTAASLLCGLATNQEVLIGARFLQGIGGAMAAAVILGMIVALFPDPREQAKAIGAFTFVAAGGASIGLLAGGVLTETINWHWIFFVNLPIGIVAAVAAIRLIDSDDGIGLREGADATGALLVTSALMLGVYTIVNAAEYGWSAGRTLGLGAVSVALLAGFVVRQATAAKPLLPLRIFRSRNVTGANLIQVLMVAGLFGMFFLGSLYMQRVLGYDPVQIGLAFLPVALVIGGLSLGVSANLSYLPDILPSMLLVGIGAGLAFPAMMILAMSSATGSDSGLASGLVNTTQQVGGALGLAVLTTLATSRSDGLLADGRLEADALTSGYHLAFVVAAGIVIVAIGLAAAILQPLPSVDQQEEAELEAMANESPVADPAT
jgi:MFS family permease